MKKEIEKRRNIEMAEKKSSQEAAANSGTPGRSTEVASRTAAQLAMAIVALAIILVDVSSSTVPRHCCHNHTVSAS